MDYHKVSLETLNSGAVAELFAVEWAKVLKNIQDPNTKPDAVRKVVIEVSVKPSMDRNRADTKVSVRSTIAQIAPHEAFVIFGSEAGTLQAFTTDPKQQEFEGVDVEVGDGHTVPFNREAK